MTYCRWLLTFPLLILSPLPAYAGPADSAPHYCAQVRDDDTLRPAPPALAGAIQHFFHLREKNSYETTQYRCAGGKVLLCNIGANLPCGKANTSTDLPGANDWCKANPKSDFIPMFVTGHDTIYAWHCEGDIAKPGKKVGSVDQRGFFEDYWKELN
jgi:hypothetical protein